MPAVLPSQASLTAGFAAEAFSCVLWVPIDVRLHSAYRPPPAHGLRAEGSERLCKSAQVVKERLQVQSALPSGSQQYRSSFDALGKIWWQVRRPILVLQTCPGLRFVCVCRRLLFGCARVVL